MRRGTTMIEMLMAVTIGLIVLAAILALYSSGAKMNRAAQSSVSLQNAMLLEEMMVEDFRQIAIDPSPDRVNFLQIQPNGVSFFKAAFPDRRIHLRPVRYSVNRTRRGNFQLVRSEQTPRGLQTVIKDGILREIQFSMVGDSLIGTTRYLHVTMVVLDDDLAVNPRVPQAYASRSTVHSVMLKVCFPPTNGYQFLQQSAQMTPDADLLPLLP
jgi:Tfp pilus assembly protein PilV